MITQKVARKFTAFFVIFGLISSVLFFGFGRFGVERAHAAAPTFVSLSAIAASTGADVTVTLPTHITNDILLLEVIVRDTNDTITWPSGWAQIATVSRGTTSRYWWAWKRAASSSETNPLVDKSTTTGDTYAAVIVYRGVTPSGDPWEVKGTPQTTTADPSVFTGITTLTSDSLVVAAVAGENDNNASIITTGTNPSAYTEHYVESNTGSDGVITFSEAVRTTTGATGNVSVNWNSAIPVGAGGVLLALKPNVPPTFSISQPDGVSDTIVQNGSYIITYTLTDTDNVVTAALYYDTNNSGLNGVAISGCGAVAEGTGITCAWNASGVAPGTYYIYGITTDGVNPQVSAYSSGAVTINATPTLSISQPDGVGDSVTQGDAYNVTYSLSDTDNIVTSAFYYDTNATGLDGTAISGCATADEGTNATCSWNTTSITPGSYYVYGITTDGTNPQVSAYSSGTLTVNAVPNASPTLSIAQPDGVGDSVTQGDPYNITYTLADTDNTVTAAFFYDSNNSGLDGTAITGACATAAEGVGAICSWDTTSVSVGSYYVYGITNDGINAQVSAYSGGTLTVNAPANSPPTLSISQPDGVGDSVTQGDAYNVTYSLSDTDNIVTSAFYYDTNNSGLDGTAISGACATAAEGTNATCSWNTTGVTPGSYYAYGITNDGVNPQVSAYSSGTLTVNAVPVINVSTVVPNAGAVGGGTNVTISGSNFQSGATITFDGVAATDIVFVDSDTLTAKTPAHIAGMVDVTVTNPDLTSDTLVSGYAYTALPVVTITASPLAVFTGEESIINWSTENATACTASGAWSGAKTISGNETVTPDTSGTYALECTGVGGSGSGSVSVFVTPPTARKEPGILFRFDGFAYPDGKVFLYDNNAPFSQLVSDLAGRFATSFRLASIEEKHLFSVIAYDKEGNISPSKTFLTELYEKGGLVDVLIAPTITLHKRALGNTENLRISGYATPGNKVQVEIDRKIAGIVPTTASGYYTLSAPLSALARGDHAVRSMQVTALSRTSDYSLLKAFQISAPFAVHADLNNDGKLTISDWSIFLSSWSSREEAKKKKIDFNNDGKITIFDLSVFLSSFKKK